MFIESPDMLDVVLEGLKLVSMITLIVVMSRSGKKYPDVASGPWRWIVIGFNLMAVAFFFDLSDEIIDYAANPLADTIETWIEEVGLIGGLGMTTYGFSSWFAFMGRFLGLKAKA